MERPGACVGNHGHMSDQSPDEAYGRVSAPERYEVLHAAGNRVVAELEERFQVERTEGPETDPELVAKHGECLRVVRLEPRIRAAAPITIAWTAFPGLYVRVGGWHIEAFPHCGCDACDEDPTELVGELHDIVDAVVGGGLTEWFDGHHLGYELSQKRGHRAGDSLIEEDQRPSVGEQARYRWEGWPLRGE
jgi:hypothetical protein